ncbi:MAG: tRNA pseudouridine synthase A, partial [Myxococcaceae bacterium]
MPRLKLTLEYEGTRYVGWQVQPNGPSIQSTLQDALQKLLGERVFVASAGRTDSGVHATGQVASFDTQRVLPMKAYTMGLNSILPPDIAVVAAEEVSPEFAQRRGSN